MIIGINKKKNIRIIASKGDKKWTVWKEKNVGRVASDKSFIKKGWIKSNTTKQEAIRAGKKYIKNKW